MYKVLFRPEVYEYLGNYFNKYRRYYENLYEDSGIWSEVQIINGYINESKNRKIEILDIIENNLKEENILGRKNNYSIILKWRTKYVFLDFEENLDLKQRYIKDISIR